MTTCGLKVREYDAADEHGLVTLWNQCLTRDEISLSTFRRKIILDTNLDTGGCLVAEQEGDMAGFMLGIRRRYPYFDVGLETGKGWITVFFVHPDFQRKGIGSALLARCEAFLSSHGVTEIHVADYTPNYIFPGIDLDAYGASFGFLSSQGYQKERSVYGMGRSLVDFSVPPEMEDRFNQMRKDGVVVTVFRPGHTLKLLEFLRKNYPGDLFRVAHDRLMEDPECDDILVATKDGEIIGFSHFLDERFGPFGIAPEYTGRGFGPMLFYSTVEQMRRKGKKNLWLAWTTGRAKDFYYKVGLRVMRRHVIMKKVL